MRVKKFTCARCGMISKRHNYMGGVGLCIKCDMRVGDEAQEARTLMEEKKRIPERLMYIFTTKQLKMEVSNG